MNREEALKIVKPHLTDHRYEHTIGVTDTAVKLAEKYGADTYKAEIAGVFHDYAKFRQKEEMKTIIVERGMPESLLTHSSELWHAPVGAHLVEKEVGIEDLEILEAIRNHTTGKPGMPLLDKVIFLADYIEPGRQFPGVEEVRELANENLDRAVLKAIQNTIIFLMKQKQLIYPQTVDTYNDLLASIKEKGK
ncbi:bis(5'-nucleosyl)-tetraphosphatase (symmetrical) YqeK [Pseudalkalibacillus caeni]|uniref:bis(5'-nucleosyl)-tetraphosphatase (symmetrical) n=1 Tax=Exobacillus caeni TaxID=2574798 RepID=A0A5R9FFF9_9BACL|nr:bis(5'-nucleosyl)-tetraphosphatase (symmetrical) YqeK [Pseudalkalibacillus caeni]TLS39334.1 HD domain-containing protein [Pseudalkalibacillus caeni]